MPPIASIASRRTAIAGPSAKRMPSIMSATITPDDISTDSPRASSHDQKSRRRNAAIHAGDQANLRVEQRRNRVAQKIGRDPHVAVADDEISSATRPRSSCRARRPWRWATPAARRRSTGSECAGSARGLPPRFVAAGLSSVAHPENHFVVGIVLLKETLQIRRQLLFHAVHWLEDRDRRQGRSWRRRTAAACAHARTAQMTRSRDQSQHQVDRGSERTRPAPASRSARQTRSTP